MPFAVLATDAAGWSHGYGAARQLALARTTIQLVAGVLAIALPVGTVVAVLLYRSDLPGRAALRRLVVVGLFVPLPLFAASWQSVIGAGGWFGPTGEWQPWLTGLNAAAWVHAMAALPWVVWIVGQGLCWVERPAEEDALTATGPVQVLLRVTLPRARGAVLAATAWVALQTANEITVSDMMQVRTFAEEVYTQFVLPDVDTGLTPEVSLARAVRVAIPGMLLVAALVVGTVLRWERSVPPLVSAPDAHPLLPLGRARWPAFFGVALAMTAYAGVPIASLSNKLGQTATGEGWSVVTAAHYLNLAAHAHLATIATSLAGALAVGVVAAVLALIACWLARDHLGWRLGLAVLIAAAWAAPGPVVGVGLKMSIERLVNLEDRFVPDGPGWLLLYNGPSMVPALWADLLRLFPFAVALLWPAVRLVPSSLTDAVRADGASPAVELRHVVWPLSATAVGKAVLAVAVLALGELSASKLVATPGGGTFAHEVFTRMHYGVGNQLAAMCLLLLAMTATLLAPFGGTRKGRKDADG
jgi:iron(III) transport system permease protein